MRLTSHFVGSPLQVDCVDCNPLVVAQPRKFRGTVSAAVDETKTAVETSSDVQEGQSTSSAAEPKNGAAAEEEFPSGELEYKKIEGLDSLLVKLRMLVAWPWQRVKKGSVLKLKLSGQVREHELGNSPLHVCHCV